MVENEQTQIKDSQWEMLLNKAREASSFAYAPYSNFKVGAALLSKDGQIFVGCNIENSSYSLTLCAERVAIMCAVSKGKKEFLALALSVPGNAVSTPCGACRQVLVEFSENLPILVEARDSGNKEVFYLGSLIPKPFRLEKK